MGLSVEELRRNCHSFLHCIPDSDLEEVEIFIGRKARKAIEDCRTTETERRLRFDENLAQLKTSLGIDVDEALCNDCGANTGSYGSPAYCGKCIKEYQECKELDL